MSIKAISNFLKFNNSSKYNSEFFDLKYPINQLSSLRRSGKQYEIVVSEFEQNNKKIINITKYDDSQHPFVTVVYNKIKQFIDGKLIAVDIKKTYNPAQHWLG